MTRQREREQFLVTMTKHGVSLDDCRKLLRYGTTLQRLAEAQCNGDWPADNGERKGAPCDKCGGGWARSTLKRQRWSGYGPLKVDYKLCPDCRTENLVRATIAAYPDIKPEFQGDPRGAVLRFHLPDGREAYTP